MSDAEIPELAQLHTFLSHLAGAGPVDPSVLVEERTMTHAAVLKHADRETHAMMMRAPAAAERVARFALLRDAVGQVCAEGYQPARSITVRVFKSMPVVPARLTKTQPVQLPNEVVSMSIEQFHALVNPAKSDP